MKEEERMNKYQHDIDRINTGTLTNFSEGPTTVQGSDDRLEECKANLRNSIVSNTKKRILTIFDEAEMRFTQAIDTRKEHIESEARATLDGWGSELCRKRPEVKDYIDDLALPSKADIENLHEWHKRLTKNQAHAPATPCHCPHVDHLSEQVTTLGMELDDMGNRVLNMEEAIKKITDAKATPEQIEAAATPKECKQRRKKPSSSHTQTYVPIQGFSLVIRQT